jgi:uncharacterized protein
MQHFLTSIVERLRHLAKVILSITLLVLAMQGVATPAYATGIYEIPSLGAGEQTWVIDEDDVLSRITEGRISNELKKLAEKTGKEVRFVTIHRLDYGETIDSFADQLFSKWFPTPEAQANQVLVTLDTVTNTSAIRAGEGVKSTLTDAIAESVAQATLQVPLRDGNKYNQAFLDVTDRLVAVLSGQPDPGAPEENNDLNLEATFKTAEETDDKNATVVVVILLVLATVIPMVTYFWYQGMS